EPPSEQEVDHHRVHRSLLDVPQRLRDALSLRTLYAERREILYQMFSERAMILGQEPYHRGAPSPYLGSENPCARIVRKFRTRRVVTEASATIRSPSQPVVPVRSRSSRQFLCQ